MGGGGGAQRCRSRVKSRGAFIWNTSASIDKNVFAKIVLFDGHAVEKWESGGNVF